MKKIAVLLCIMLCLFLTGCDNSFAREEYNDNKKIAAGDHYTAVKSVIRDMNDGCSFKAEKFDGRETLWTYTAKSEELVGVSVSLHNAEGSAKVVFIDAQNNVETLAEFSGEELIEQEYKEVTLTKGTNKFKIVGYDCQHVELLIDIDF